MLERLDDLIRPLLTDAENTAKTSKTFHMNADMMSIMGCGAQDLGEILSALGYRCTKPAQNVMTCEPLPAERETTSEAPAPTETQNKEAEASNGETEIDDPLTWTWQLTPRAGRGGRARKTPSSKKADAKRQTRSDAKSGAAQPRRSSNKRRRKPTGDIDLNSPFAALRDLTLSKPEKPTEPQEQTE